MEILFFREQFLDYGFGTVNIIGPVLILIALIVIGSVLVYRAEQKDIQESITKSDIENVRKTLREESVKGINDLWRM